MFLPVHFQFFWVVVNQTFSLKITFLRKLLARFGLSHLQMKSESIWLVHPRLKTNCQCPPSNNCLFLFRVFDVLNLFSEERSA